MKIAGVALVCLVLMAVPAQAQVAVPDTMNYQATLLDTAGAPVTTGSYVVEISLFDASSAGNLVWGPQKFNGGSNDGEGPEIQVINGEFSVILGPIDTAATPRNLTDAFLEANRWLEITIIDFPALMTDTIFAPRQRILSAPYAMRAKDAETLGNQTLQVTPGGIVMVTKAAAPTLRLENSDTGASGNKSVLEFTESGGLRGQVGFTSTGTGTDFVVQSLVSGGKLVLKSLGDIQIDKNLVILGSGSAGDVFLGNVGLVNKAAFSNATMKNSTSFALAQDNGGQVILNAPNGQVIDFRIANSDKMRLTNTLFRVFGPEQIDGNLAVPTINDTVKLGNLSGFTDFAGFAHRNFFSIGNYAVGQDRFGATIINSPSNRRINFTQGGSGKAFFELGSGRNTSDIGGTVLHIRGELRLSPNVDFAATWTLSVDDDGADSDLFFYHRGVFKAWIEPGNGSWNQSSDRRLKKDITDLGNALDASMKLRPVSFRYKSAPDSSRKNIGFVAQDVQEVIPELVSDGDETLGLNYSGFGVLAIGAIQELNEKFLAEQKKNEDLEDRLQQLEDMVDGLMRSSQ